MAVPIRRRRNPILVRAALLLLLPGGCVACEAAPIDRDRLPDRCARGAAERARPILMTALVTGLGLLPIALGRAEAGREIEGPMALVILGGLVSSTLLNFLLLPALCRRFGRFTASARE